MIKTYRFIIAIAVALLIVPTPQVRAEDQFVGNVGSWEVYTWSRENERPTACYIYGHYRSDISLYVFYGPEDGYELIFSNDDWRLQEDQAYDVSIEIDRFGAWDATLTAYNSTSVHTYVDDEFISEFRRGFEMVVNGANQDLFFELKGTSRALEAVHDCVRKHVRIQNANPFAQNGGSNRDTDNPFGSANSNSGRSDSRSEDEPLTEAQALKDLELFMHDVFENRMFAKTRMLKDHEEDEVLPGFEIRWIDDGVAGAATVSELSVGEYAQEMLSEDAENCDGRFGSARETRALTDRVEATNLASFCDSEDPWSLHYTLLSYRNFTIAVLHISRDPATSQDFDDRFNRAVAEWFQS